MATNIGHLFYKQYFTSLKFDINTGKAVLDDPVNQKLYDLKLSDYPNLIETPFKNKPVSLTTIYPGLLIGSGYIHEVGGEKIVDELKLGFFFDHTTGLPVIPGSSVKGLLRSAFKKAGGEYVKELLNELKITIDDGINISSLEKAIFENSKGASVYKRDIFFDAYPISSGNDHAAFLANDYITPHENPLKNPNLVQFLKILPDVQFQFNFKLTDSDGLSAENKLKLYEQILLDLGIGAKTNVGYGQFSDKEYLDNTIADGTGLEDRLNENHIKNPRVNTPDPIIEKFSNINNEYTEGKQYKATLIRREGEYFVFKVGKDTFVKKIENIKKRFNKDAANRINKGKSGNYKTLAEGDEVFIRINNASVEQINFTVMPVWTD